MSRRRDRVATTKTTTADVTGAPRDTDEGTKS